MRVLHIVPTLFDEQGRLIGGAERYALELARNMAFRVPTRLVSFGARASTQRIDDLEITIIGNPWRVRGNVFNPLALSLFREVLRGGDVIHCHQQHVLASSLSALLSRASGRKVFATDLGGGGWDFSAYVSTDNWFHGHLHLSQYSRKVVRQENDPRSHVIMGGVDTVKFSPNRTSAGPRAALFVGRLLPHKGVNYLIEGVPPEMPLDIYGPPAVGGPHGGYYKTLQDLAAGKNVTFVHPSGDHELVPAYQRALCIVLPSVYTTAYGAQTKVPELLGQTLLEGMACGLPAICTDVASMPEVVVEGVTGFVVPPNDPRALWEKIRWLRDHPEEADAMGRAGRQRVLDHFTWASVVQRCLDIYQSAS